MDLVGGIEGQAGLLRYVGHGDVAFCDGLVGAIVVLVESEVKIGDARANLDVLDAERRRPDSSAPCEFEMQIYWVRTRAGWVGELHMGAGADEKGGSCIAAIGHWTESQLQYTRENAKVLTCPYRPALFESELVVMRGCLFDGYHVCKGRGLCSHGVPLFTCQLGVESHATVTGISAHSKHKEERRENVNKRDD